MTARFTRGEVLAFNWRCQLIYACLIVGASFLYLAVGITIAGASMSVWLRKDSTSWLARILFPWNARDRCVGDNGLSLFGEFLRHDFAPVPAYTLVLAIAWPIKIFWCCCTRVWVAFNP